MPVSHEAAARGRRRLFVRSYRCVSLPCKRRIRLPRRGLPPRGAGLPAGCGARPAAPGSDGQPTACRGSSPIISASIHSASRCCARAVCENAPPLAAMEPAAIFSAAPCGFRAPSWIARCLASSKLILSLRARRRRRLPLQGNRISKQGQELGEICVVPSGAFEFAAKGSFGGILLHHVQRHVSQHREVVWPVAQSAPVLILVHDDIEPPV